MTWYAIKTHPGAQMPQREYAKEDVRGGKGYRIVTSLNPRMSAVERSLRRIGVSFYMPCEFRAVRDRRKTATFTLRRFPALQGYLFVHDVVDWLKLSKAPGVAGVVQVDGKPFGIAGNDDILALWMRERTSESEAYAQIERWRADEARARRKAHTKAVADAKRRISAGSRVRVLWGANIGHEAKVTAWEKDGRIAALVKRLGDAEGHPIEVNYDEVELLTAAE